MSTIVNGRAVERGTEVTIKGLRGRYVYQYMNPDGSGCFYGGATGHEMFRDFHLDRVARVHYKNKTRFNRSEAA